MEKEPDYTNVHFIDEYPHLEEKARLRRLHAQQRLGVFTLYHSADVVRFPNPPDDSA